MTPPEVVGPVPEGVDPEEYDRRRRRALWAMPSGLYLIGSHATVDGVARWNLMTANWTMQVSLRPKLVAVAVDAEAVTAALIDTSGAFSVSLLERADRGVVRRFVKPVTEIETDPAGRPRTMAAEEVDLAPSGAPVLARSAAWIDCRLHERRPLGSHVLYVGEVTAVGGESEGKEILRMEDTRMNYGG
jgi:flavin reductase (DIM6/NTAB) family NADH-FMN oxidoreductase RutF